VVVPGNNLPIVNRIVVEGARVVGSGGVVADDFWWGGGDTEVYIKGEGVEFIRVGGVPAEHRYMCNVDGSVCGMRCGGLIWGVVEDGDGKGW